MKKSKLLIGAAVILPAVSLLASCGPSSDPPGTKIVFWHCLGKDKTTNLEKIVAKFNETYSGQYWVQAVKLSGDYDSLHSDVKVKLQNGEVPGLTMGYPDSFSEYIGKSEKERFILQLDDFINDPVVGYTQEELDDFVDAYYAEGTHYQEEGTWSMPMYKSTEVMYYNAHYFYGDNPCNNKKFSNNQEFKNLVALVQNNPEKPGSTKKEARMSDLEALKAFCETNDGYTYEIPTTWTEAFELAAQMKADRTAEGITGTFFPMGYDSDANLLISAFAESGIGYTKNDEESILNPEKHFLFNTQEAKDLVSYFYSNLNGKGNPGYMITKGTIGGYTNEYFNDGRLVMSIGSTGGSSYQVSENFKVLLADVPCFTDGDGNLVKKYIQQGPSICFFDNANDDIHTGSWLFYKMLAEKDNNTALALENSYDPIRKSCYETEAYTNWIARKDEGLKYAIPAKTAELKDYYFTSPVFIGSGEARTQMSLIFEHLRSNYTVDQAFEEAMNKCKMAVQ